MNNKVNKREEVPKHLLLTAILSTGLTIALSLVYITLSILGLVYRFNCDVGLSESSGGADYFANTLFRVYIQKDDCDNSLSLENLTAADSVFLLNIFTLIASVLCLVLAIVLIVMATDQEKASQLCLVAYIYVGVCVASLVIDLTFASHFGMDYSYLTQQLNLSNPGLAMNYDRDIVRLGALLLMTLSMKGYLAHIINLILLILLVVYVVEYRRHLNRDEHSIHKLGALNAYDQPRRRQDSWQQEPSMFLGLHRGPQMNSAFVEDSAPPPRSPMRDPVMLDYQRSDSWQPAPMSNSRPFSYLEEPKRAARAPASPAVESPRRRDWPPPPVPAPDYSPQTPRRLKSALKPSYM